MKLRKLKDTANGFEGVIEEAYWLNAQKERFTRAPGVFPLFLCLEQDSVVTEDGPIVTQSFVIPEQRTSEFAHRALVTLLRFSTRRDDVHWRRTLETLARPPIAQDGLRKAAQEALAAGFVQYICDIQPGTMPDFLVSLKG